MWKKWFKILVDPMVFWSKTHLFCLSLIFQNEEFSNFSVCPFSVRKIGVQLYLQTHEKFKLKPAKKSAVKPVARLDNIITSCQSSKVFTGFKFVGDITISL